jgi:lysine biosynthesis protein LysW
MFMNITCPGCGRSWRVPESMLGQVMTCPDCGASFQCGTVSPPSLEGRLIRSESADPVQAAPDVRAVQLQPESQIYYRCPRCSKALESPIDAAGRKLNCPDCGQRLQVPQAGRRLATSVADAPAAAPRLPSNPEKIRAKPAVVAKAPASATRREHCPECGMDVSQRPRVQTCPDCGSLFCSARCYREHSYHAHPSRY